MKSNVIRAMFTLHHGAALAVLLSLAASSALATNWSYDGSASQKYLLDDTGWKFKISLNQRVSGVTGTTVGACTEAGTADTLDFSAGLPSEVGTIVKMDGTFYNSPGKAVITAVVLPQGIVHLGEATFRECPNLESVEPLLPDSIVSVGRNCFYQDAKLKGHARVGCNAGTTLVYGTFWNCSSLQEVTVGDGVTSIPEYAFYGCSSVTNMTLGANIASFGGQCCRNMTELRRITPFLPESVSKVMGNAFNGARKLEGTLVLRGGAEGTGDMTWDGQFQFARLGISNIVIGAGITTIPNYCFSGNTSVTEVDFNGFPTWQAQSFHYNSGDYKWSQYQARFLIPYGDPDWTTYISDSTKVTPWDGSKLADYQSKFGVDAELPVGITVGDNKQYVVIKPRAGTGAKSLTVSAESTVGGTLEIGAVVPAYGTHDDVSDDLPLSCSAPEYADNGNTRYRCAGHVLYAYDGVSWADVQTNASRTFTYNPDDDTMRRLVWLWEPAGFKVTVGFPSELGSVAASAPWADDFYAAGSTATFTATPSNGVPFGCWTGTDAPYPLSMAATLSLTVDGEKSLVPYFVTNWVLAANGTSISDGYWSIPMSGATNALKLVSCGANYDDIAILDLRKPVEGGAITAIGQNFALNRAAARNIRELLLPDTLQRLENSAFNGLSLLETVTPFLPASVTDIRDRAFEYCPSLVSDLTLGMDKRTQVSFSGEAHFAFNHAMRKAIMGPGVQNLPRYCFFGMNGFEEAVLLADEIALDEWAFHNTPVKTVKFAGFPTFGVAPFHNHADYTACIYVPRGDARWEAFMADPEEMTPWNQLDASAQNQYWSRYPDGKTPKGMTLKTTGSNRFGRMWVFLWSPKSNATILSLR